MEKAIVRQVVARYLMARRLPLTVERIRQVQQEAEIFGNNAEAIDNEADHARVQKAAYAWRNSTKPLYAETMKFVVDIADNMADRKKADRLLSTWRAKFKPLFDLVLEVGGFPDWQYWQKLSSEWTRKVRSLAAKLDDVVKYLGTLGKQKMTPLVHQLTSEQRTVAGFHVHLIEYDAENPKHAEALEAMREALEVYRRRARETLPLLLKMQVPFRVDFSITPSLWGAAGFYRGNLIDLNPFSSGPRDTTMTIAHEMGHHLYEVWLTEPKKSFWRGALAKDWTQLDLTEVLAEWNKRPEYWASFMSDLTKTDPILYLQLEGALSHSQTMPKELRADEGWSRANLERYLAEGGKRHVRVPSSPITAYATTNPNEAFCEAVGMLVAYGPRAVVPLVREWLSIIFGGHVKSAESLSF